VEYGDSNPGRCKSFFSSSKLPDRFQPPIQSLVVNSLGPKNDDTPSNAQAKDNCSYVSVLLICLLNVNWHNLHYGNVSVLVEGYAALTNSQ
jgi:hypothetical protein